MKDAEIKSLCSAARQAEEDALLDLRRVAELTGTPLSTIKRWTYIEGVLPHEHVGPTRRVRVRLSVVRQFFPVSLSSS